MGASGNLAVINLKEHPFKEIKNLMLDEIYNWMEFNLGDDEADRIFDEVYEMETIEDFIRIFNSKVVSFCPIGNGVLVNEIFYDDWADEIMPQIINNHLVLYETDQQMQYQNYPVWMLSKLIEQDVEIWT